MNKYLPSIEAITQNIVLTTIGLVAAGFIISKFPKLKQWANAYKDEK